MGEYIKRTGVNTANGSFLISFYLHAMSKKERIIIILLASINFTHILDFMIMMPLGNYLMPFFHISPKQFSFLVASYPITAFISGFTAAFFVDRFDRKKILVFAYIGFLLGTLACGFAPNYGMLLAARTLTGLFGGLIGAQVAAASAAPLIGAPQSRNSFGAQSAAAQSRAASPTPNSWNRP